MNLSRRDILKRGAAGGVTGWPAPLHGPARAALLEDKHATPIPWNRVDRSVKFRIYGTAKAVGGKVFAYDTCARDMPHWPQQQSHACLLRGPFAGRRWRGPDLSSFEPELRPDRVVTAEDLVRDRVAFPPFNTTRNAAGEIVALSPVQQKFLERYSFQCGYCTPGFVNGATVLMERLRRQPVVKSRVERVVTEALDVHLCRCTGYVRYYAAVKDLILSTPGPTHEG